MAKEKQGTEVAFEGKIIRCVYNSDNYKVYGVEVDHEKYPNIKRTKYSTATICGDLHDLAIGINYRITAVESQDKYGYSYHVTYITRDRPTSFEDTYTFLQEILTFQQAETLYNVYPNIVDKIINNDIEDVDLNLLKGIKEKTFERIKEKVIENFCLVELVVEFKGMISLSILKKLHEKYTSIIKIKQNLQNNPYKCLCGLSRIGFKNADAILLDVEKISKDKITNGEPPIIDFREDLKSSSDRCLACMMYLLEKNEEEGNTIMDIAELRDQVIKLCPACCHHFIECIKFKDIYYDKETMMVALRYTFETELYIAESINSRLKNEPTIWDVDVYKYQKINDISLSEEQMNLLKETCRNNIIILAAPAGTGKSFSTKALINMFKDNNKSFALASPTGKAAKKLSSYTGEKAQTIHRLLGYMNGKFIYDETNQLQVDVLLLDEVGMVDIWLLKSLLKAISINTKIILVGDKYQLNSVGCGAVFRDLISYNRIPQVNYNKVYRMGEGGVLTVCTYIRETKQYLNQNSFTQIGTDKSYTFIPSTKENINKNVISLYNKLLEKYSSKDITVLSSYNVGDNGSLKLNGLLQPLANPNAKECNQCIRTKQGKEEVKFYVGDIVLANANNYHAKLFENQEIVDECMIANGDQGEVVQIYNNGLVINFDGITIYYSYSELKDIRHAFAISCHKMQGSQNKIIIFSCPSSHIYMLSNNIIYTALSRAEKNVYHLSDLKTINTSIKKSDSEKRRTVLRRLLLNNNEQNDGLNKSNIRQTYCGKKS